ncbi:MAG TPA: DUF1360 domain-containing protein [Solirubrobacteraceae bacterium]|jgi:hypothetical protein|nr:DUF1360 domain-containing protein [Solirubrobacteraceae bacterium]
MASERLHEVVAGYSPGQEDPPLGGYAALMGLFVGVTGAFTVWMRHSQRELPERVSASDLALMTVATHKAARLLAKDRVTSAVRAPFTSYEAQGGPGEVEEHARGSGLRRAVGELLICPYCLGMWIATAFAVGLTLAPRPTRWAASVLVAHFGSDVLQAAYKKLEDSV